MSEEVENAVVNENAESDETEVSEQPQPKKRGRKSKYGEKKITGKVDSEGLINSVSEIEKETMVTADEIVKLLTDSMKQAYLEFAYPGLPKNKDKNKEETDPTSSLIDAKIVFSENFKKFEIYDLKTVTNEDDIVDDAYQISLEDAKEISKKAKLGDVVEIPFDVKTLNKSYIRRVKQLFQSHLKETERNNLLENFNNKKETIIEGVVTTADVEKDYYEVSFGKAKGQLKKQLKNLIPLGGKNLSYEKFALGDRVEVYLDKISDQGSQTRLEISRTCPAFVAKLLEKSVPELANGTIVIKAIARKAGLRTKVFVDTLDENIDPVGTCIGPESMRLKNVTNELNGEKIDILRWYPNKAKQIIEALKPANIIGLTCLDEFFDPNYHFEEVEKQDGIRYEFPDIKAIVSNGAQGVAIGSGGVNVKLASTITKCKISILQADEALQQKIPYMMSADIDRKLNIAPKTVEIVPEDDEELTDEEIGLVVDDNHEEQKPEETTTVETVESENVVKEQTSEEKKEEVETKPVEEEKPAEVEHVEIINKPKISLSDFEEAKTKKTTTTRSSSKKKKAEDEKKNTPSLAAQQKAMSIYTEEELKALDENNEEYEDNEENDYEDEDYSEYDDDSLYDEDR